MTRDQIIARLEEIGGELEQFDPDNLDEQSEARYDELVSEADELRTSVENAEARQAKRDEVRKAIESGRATVTPGEDRGVPNVHVKTETPYEVAGRRHSEPEIRDAAMRVIEERIDRPEWQESAERHARRGGKLAEHIVRFADPLYERAWGKMATGQDMLLTSEERAAIAVGTSANGGYLVPTHLDPTVLLSNDGTINPFRGISRVVTLSPQDGNTWNGVTSAGATASWDTETTEVSDDSPTFAQPSIPVEKGAAYVQSSVEAFQDIGNLGSDVVMVLQDAKDRLEAAAFATGSGSDQPTGIFTALDANTNVELEVTSQGAIAAADIYALYEAVPPRFRGQGTFVSNLKWINIIRQLGSSDPNFTVDMTAEGIPQLFGKRIVESSDAPTTRQTTTVDNLIVYGDFSQYVIVDKVGMSVQFQPLGLGSNNRPNGTVGWYAYWRTGADSVIDTAFTLLQDGTSV